MLEELPLDVLEKMFDLIAFALTHFGNARLEGTGEDLAECGNLLLEFVGLDPVFPTTGLGNPDFAAEICEAGEMCEVVTDTKFAGTASRPELSRRAPCRPSGPVGGSR